MPLYAFEGGRALPIIVDRGATRPWGREALAEIRDLVLDIVEHRLFPVSWRSDDPMLGEYLVALDANKSAVVVLVRERLDSEVLVAALARSALVRRASWSEVDAWYPRGRLAQEWERFRDTNPLGPPHPPGLVVAAGVLTPTVREALTVLEPRVVIAHEVTPRWREGRRVFEVERAARSLVPRGALIEVGEQEVQAVVDAGIATRAEAEAEPLREFEIEFAGAHRNGVGRSGLNTAGGQREMSQNGHVSGQPRFGPKAELANDLSDGEPTESQPTRRLRRRDFRPDDGLTTASPPRVFSPQPAAQVSPDPRSSDASRVGRAAAVAAPSAVNMPHAPVEAVAPHAPVEAHAPVAPNAPVEVHAPVAPSAPVETLPSRRSRRPAESLPEVTPAQSLAAVVAFVGESELVLDGSSGRIRAVLGRDGSIAAAGGRYADPTQAARLASGRAIEDGWLAWRFGEDGPFLGEALEEARRAEREAGQLRRNRRRAVER